MTKGPEEVARLFGGLADPPGNAGASVYPGYPGYVLAQGRVRQMAWGFPLAMKGKNGQPLKPKPVNNARTDTVIGPSWSFNPLRRHLAPRQIQDPLRSRLWSGSMLRS